MITDFASLKQEIIDTLDRSDLSTFVETFIQLAEDRHKVDIRIREMLVRENLTITGTTRFIPLPSGFLEMKMLRNLNDPDYVLREVALDEIVRHREETEPRFFTIHTEIELDVEVDATATLEAIYYKAPTALSDTDTTNVILTRSPSVYLYASLLAAEPFLANDERLQTWSTLYTASRDSLNALDRKRSGPLVARVHGATP